MRSMVLRYTIFRFFNTYGPSQSEDFVVPKFLKAAIRNHPLTIFGDETQTRTFCYIDDNTDTMISCFENDMFLNDDLNIGPDVETSIEELADLILKVTGSKSYVENLPPLKEGDMARRKPAISRMRSILGRELIRIDKGIGFLLAHYSKVDTK